jgi:hypothetical protein
VVGPALNHAVTDRKPDDLATVLLEMQLPCKHEHVVDRLRRMEAGISLIGFVRRE